MYYRISKKWKKFYFSEKKNRPGVGSDPNCMYRTDCESILATQYVNMVDTYEKCVQEIMFLFVLACDLWDINLGLTDLWHTRETNLTIASRDMHIWQTM